MSFIHSLQVAMSGEIRVVLISLSLLIAMVKSSANSVSCSAVNCISEIRAKGGGSVLSLSTNESISAVDPDMWIVTPCPVLATLPVKSSFLASL